MTSASHTMGAPSEQHDQSAFTLYPDQQECLDRVRQAYQQRPQGGRALVVAPTGWGKTVLFSSFISWWQEQKKPPVLLLAHRDELLTQAHRLLQTFLPSTRIGKFGGGVYDDEAPITLAGIDTISRREHLPRLKQRAYGLVICDECHHAPAPKYRRVLAQLSEAFWLGVTATPDRLDQQSLEMLFGPPVFTMTLLEAIAMQRLCDVRAIAIRTETNLETVASEQGDYREKDLEAVIDTPERNQRVVEAYREHASGKRALCFAVTIPHAAHLAEAFEEAGVPAAVVTGDTPMPERQKLYQALRTGTIKVLTNVQVLTEGYDEPLIECIVMARPTQSRALFIQCIGRGLRLAPGKTCCLVLDLTDNTLKHQLTPQHLGSALQKDLHLAESIREGLARERDAREAAKREQAARLLHHKRTHDITVPLLSPLVWQPHADGSYSLTVDPYPYQLFLTPSPEQPGSYEVWAQFGPRQAPQCWQSALPLDWAQQYAERQARQLQADEHHRLLVDRSAGWRRQPVDPESKQAYWLHHFAIENWQQLTRGEASDLLEECFRARDERRRRQTTW